MLFLCLLDKSLCQSLIPFSTKSKLLLFSDLQQNAFLILTTFYLIHFFAEIIDLIMKIHKFCTGDTAPSKNPQRP